MNNKIGILHLEDSVGDSELIHLMIESSKIGHEYFLVEKERDFINILETENINIILSDYNLPGYDGNEALSVVKEKHPEIPFIFVSGAMGEDSAIEAMLNGATDYVLKTKLERLVPAIKRALNENELKIKRQLAEQELIVTNEELRLQIEEKEKQAAELIIAKEKAEESERLKSAFLANMSHELRTPLNSIIGFSELMIDPDYDTAQQHKFAHMINASGNNLLAIINDIMDISKIEAGQIRIKKAAFSVDKLMDNIKNEYSLKAVENGLELKLDSSDSKTEVFITTDETKLKQIFANLVGNAIKFTKSGFVHIGFKTVGDFVQFHIKDTGIGISAEFHEQIFERFRQVELSLNRKYGGNGLGLSISKSLIELMGGTIWLESELGKGSTFYFLIPISQDQTSGITELSEKQKAPLHQNRQWGF